MHITLGPHPNNHATTHVDPVQQSLDPISKLSALRTIDSLKASKTQLQNEVLEDGTKNVEAVMELHNSDILKWFPCSSPLPLYNPNIPLYIYIYIYTHTLI